MRKNHKTAEYANESLRFVQLSDLHLSSIQRPNPLRLLNKRILGYLSWQRKRRFSHQTWIIDKAIEQIKQLNVDHYAITGDLTHIGLKDEFNQVAQWLRSVAGPEDITVIPGNHDLYINERWQRSFLLWQPYLYDQGAHINAKNINPNNALQTLDQLYPVVRIRKNVAFICLSSVYAAPWWRATGWLAKPQLARLQTLLSNKSLDQFCKIILIHHPVTLTYTSKRKSLINCCELNAILKAYPVQLILHGHGHYSCTDSLACNNRQQIPIIGMASSSSANQSKNYQAEFLVFDITQKSSYWQIDQQRYKLNMRGKQFVAQAKQTLQLPICHD